MRLFALNLSHLQAETADKDHRMVPPARSHDSVPVCFAPPEYLAEVTEPIVLIGESMAAQKLRLQIDRIGPHFRTVLLQGETGTGKEAVARALHTKSSGSAELFSRCDGIMLAKSTTEAHIEGSPWQPFITPKRGTIFLDAADALSLPAQELLQQLLAESSWRHTAGPKIITATTHSLRRMVVAGHFRADLYRRLAAVEILIEPVRRRRDDIPALAAHILGRLADNYGRTQIAISDQAMARLREYDWPGNLLEMVNVIAKSLHHCNADLIESRHVEPMLRTICEDKPACHPEDGIEKLQEVIVRHVKHVLQLCAGNKVRAAEMLGISRSTLYRMLEGTEKLG